MRVIQTPPLGVWTFTDPGRAAASRCMRRKVAVRLSALASSRAIIRPKFIECIWKGSPPP